MKKRRIMIAMLIGTMALSGIMAGCGTNTSNTQSSAEAESGDSADSTQGKISLLDTSDMFTKRDLDAFYDESECTAITLDNENSSCDSDAVTIDGQTVTITSEGTYLISGTLSNGSIVIDVEDSEKVQLVFDNVSITNESGAAVYVRQADKVFLTLADGSENTVVSNGTTTEDDSNIDGAIFAKGDLTINGTGTLNVTSAAHGIVCKDDLVVTGGTYTISAEKQGLSGKDSVRIADGTFDITSGGDAIHSENADDENKGFVYVANGSFTLNADGDGISASYVVQLDDGTYEITAGGGSANVQSKNSMGDKGPGNMQDNGETTESDSDTSTKGIKATSALQINGGTYHIDSADDSIHSNGDVYINAGTFDLSTGDDGIHADSTTDISDGTITISQCYEGLEGQTIDISGGVIDITASDDGLNAAGGNDSSNSNGPGGGDPFSAAEDAYINISGGQITIDATGDGIDSNGDLTVSGGTIFVTGPANDGNGAMDYNGTATITGGTVVAAGMSGMAQNFGDDSSQGSMLINLDDTQSGEITLTDADGKELISFTPSREYNSVIISCADLEEGATYTLNTGETATEVTLSSLVYSNGQSQGGQPGEMQNGQMPDQNGQSDSNAPSGQPGDGTDPGQGGPGGNGNGGPGGQPGQGGPGQNNSSGQSGS
ncbi:carbohydrate-binding domain-containing protein [uncultured Eubacterium sp.]|uniref:carbohydrate-binding domain-containing protein n=1 Tax=uncultured Eubacterium sp. TaxID=165185 RepID=UPI0025E8C2BF|nr:carbohydrate-binding domain-containing protein [uncultured Eubacterium sp.]